MHFLPGVPCILVGLKKDLRYDEEAIKELKKYNEQPVTWKQVIYLARYSTKIIADLLLQGNDMAKRIGISKYVECSAKTGDGVREVFEIAVGLRFPAVKKRSDALKSMFKRWSSK